MHYAKKQKRFFPDSFYNFIKFRFYELAGICLISLNIAICTAIWDYNSTDNSLNSASSIAKANNVLGIYGAIIADLGLQYMGKISFLLFFINIIWGIILILHRPIKNVIKKAIVLFISVASFSCLLSILPFFSIGYVSTGIIGSVIIKNLYIIFTEYSLEHLFIFVTLPFLLISVTGFWYSSSLTMDDLQKIKRYLILCISKITNFLKYMLKNILPKKTPYTRNSASVERKSLITDNEKLVQKEKTVTNTDYHKKVPSLNDYNPPSLNLLQVANHKQNIVKNNEIENNLVNLSKTLNDFGIKGQILRALPGPIVTLYEFEPAPGIKSSRLIGLADDIARSMSAISARIAVIPGKNVIGIELPNNSRNKVFLRELFSDEKFINNTNKLNIALGKTISGVNIFADLAKMPHMIVAGTTGSGKSVAVNAMILSILYQHSPETCKLILIDPKMLELSVYNDIPHLLSPVVTNPKKAIFALKWAVREMENRYKSMSNVGVRNIEGYNQHIEKAISEGKTLTRKIQTGFDEKTGNAIYEEKPIDMTKFPYIVIVVDEMADLMMVAGKDIESAVQRLAQMARAAGIHVVMATQRPSVDVITGTIKANFPTRISFQVASRFDSRTILGEQGAEQLLGSGDMLFMESGGRIRRLHGPFVSDEEVTSIVKFLKSNGSAKYVTNITDENQESEKGLFSDAKAEDDLYNTALEIVKKEQKASTSFIQRRLQIGYNRAARIIEAMEENGIVSSANHAGKREILINN